MRKLLLLLLLCFSFTSVLFSQVPPDWYMDKPIVEIKFKGLSNVAESELEGITGQYIGRNFTDELFLELQSKLYALDFFEVFTPNALPGDDEYTTLIIEFEVVERPVIDEIKLEGNRNIRKGDILDTILLKRGDMVNKTKVRLDSDSIRDLYLERGYPDISVEGEIIRLEGEEEGLAQVVFKIVEGSQTKISEILFSGNTFASANTLRREMTTKKQSLFSTGVFMDSKLEEDLQLIELYYKDRGYIDVHVVDVVKDLQYSEKDQKNYMTITIYIEEGNQYYYGGIKFEGNSLFSDEELTELVRQKVGNVLSFTKLEQDFVRIADVYYDDGYIYNTIEKKEERDEETRTITYIISFVERGRAHIENIIFTGNEKTKDYVLYRELPLEVGDIFSKEKIMEGLENLYNTGFFSTVSPTTPMGSADGLMDLIINVEEGKTIDINFGVTFSGEDDEFPVLGFVEWEDSNFMGKGQEISIGAEVSASSQLIELGFTENWLFGRRWSGGIDFSFEHERTSDVMQDILAPVFSADDPNRVPDPYDGHYVFTEETVYNGTTYSAGEAFPGMPTDDEISDYDLLTDYGYALELDESIDSAYLMEYHSYDFSLGASTGYRWITGIGRFGIGGGPEVTLTRITYDSELYRPYNYAVRANLDEWKFVDSIWTRLYWDTRDLIYNPSNGSYIAQKFTFTGGPLGGSRHYIRSTSKAEGFLTLFEIPFSDNFSFKAVLAAHTSFTILLPTLGWDSLKAKYSIDPDEPLFVTTEDDELYIDGMMIARGWDYTQEGEALWDNWIELRFPIAEQYLWWDFFFSSTAMWQDKDSMRDMNIDDFLFSFGGGLRITIPGLPIGFYLTKRFKTEDGVIEWQTGDLFNSDDEEGKGIDLAISFTYELY